MIKLDLHIETAIFHPQTTYGWKVDETGIGIADFRFKGKKHLWVKVGKDEKFVYKIDTEKAFEFLKKHPNSCDDIKGIKIFVLPIQKWGKKHKIYIRYDIKTAEKRQQKKMFKELNKEERQQNIKALARIRENLRKKGLRV